MIFFILVSNIKQKIYLFFRNIYYLSLLISINYTCQDKLYRV